MDVRKALAFAGFTHKSPRVISYARLDKVGFAFPRYLAARSCPRESYLYVMCPAILIYRSTQVLMDPKLDDQGAAEDAERGRKTVRERGTVRGRAISM